MMKRTLQRILFIACAMANAVSPTLPPCSGELDNSITLTSAAVTEGDVVYARRAWVSFTCSVTVTPVKMQLCFGTVAYNITSLSLVDRIGTWSITDIPLELNGSFVSCVMKDDTGQSLKSHSLHFFILGSGEGAGTTDSTTLPTTAATTAGDVPTFPATTDAGPGTPNNTNMSSNSEDSKIVIISTSTAVPVTAAVIGIAIVILIICLYCKHRQIEVGVSGDSSVAGAGTRDAEVTQVTIFTTDEPLRDGDEMDEANKFSESIAVKKDLPTDPVLPRQNTVPRSFRTYQYQRTVPAELDCTHQHILEDGQEESIKQEIDEVAIDDINGSEVANENIGDILNDSNLDSQLSGSSQNEPGLTSRPEEKDSESAVISQSEEQLHALSEGLESDSLSSRHEMVVCTPKHILPTSQPKEPRDKPQIALPLMDVEEQEMNFFQCDSKLFHKLPTPPF